MLTKKHLSRVVLALLTLVSTQVVAQNGKDFRLEVSAQKASADGGRDVLVGTELKISVRTPAPGMYFEIWTGQRGKGKADVEGAMRYIKGVSDANGEFTMLVKIPWSMAGLELEAEAVTTLDGATLLHSNRLHLTFLPAADTAIPSDQAPPQLADIDGSDYAPALRK